MLCHQRIHLNTHNEKGKLILLVLSPGKIIRALLTLVMNYAADM